MATQQQILGAWILLIAYAALVLFFVIRGALRTKNIQDYAIGNLNFSPAFVGLSLAVSMTSAATFVINPALITIFGFSGVLSFGVFFPIASMISLVILTKSFRKYGQATKATTLAQWMGRRYNSSSYSLFMGFMSFLLITFIVLILVALAKVLSAALNLNQVYILTFIIVFVFGYMMFGGANSLVYTNTLQAFVMLVVAIILLTSGLEHFRDGIQGFVDKLAAIDPVLVKSTNPGSLLFRDYYEIIFAQIVIGVAVVCQPHIITKSLFLKKESDVNKFLVSAVIAQMLFFSVVFVGLYARIQFPDLTANGQVLNADDVIPTYVITIFSSGWFSVVVGLIVILGLLSAGLSTLEGLIQSLSTIITSDIIKPLFGEKIKDESSYMVINKMAIVFLAVVSFFIARDQLLFPKLSVAILAQNGVYAFFSIAFLPIVLGIFSPKAGLKAAVAASATALVVHFSVYYMLPMMVEAWDLNMGFFTKYLQGEVRNPAIAASTAIVFSTVVGLTVHFLSKNKTSEV
ncbi:MAG: sodium:solute symporter [Bacteroidetes bacterium]|nr:MAG: sodium:solute symporter [Bacteroidota bacterium]